MSSLSTYSYDQIAHLYEIDMARNMTFDDIGFYTRCCHMRAGLTLEIGCGTGRIMRRLLEKGIEVVGIDRSHRMLVEFTRAYPADAQPPRIAQMDMEALALRRGFSVVYAPGSVLTYLLDSVKLVALFNNIGALLCDRGLFVIDVFIPRPIDPSGATFSDYRRHYQDMTLVRSKQITPLSAELNRIERHYRFFDQHDKLVNEIITKEIIRPITPESLKEMISGCGFRILDEVYDYGENRSTDTAQHYQLIAER